MKDFVALMTEIENEYKELTKGHSEMMSLVMTVARSEYRFRQYRYRSPEYNIHYGINCRSFCNMRDLLFANNQMRRKQMRLL